MDKKPVGRPKVKEKVGSATISITPSRRQKIEKEYGSLTNAVKTIKLKND